MKVDLPLYQQVIELMQVISQELICTLSGGLQQPIAFINPGTVV
jgi:hypothetical protein